jgi:hypothetical protein
MLDSLRAIAGRVNKYSVSRTARHGLTSWKK